MGRKIKGDATVSSNVNVNPMQLSPNGAIPCPDGSGSFCFSIEPAGTGYKEVLS